MAQTGNFTPILLYSSSTTGNTPGAANLLNSADGSEMAINIADGRLFYKDPGGVVQKIADKLWNGTVTSVAALTLGTTGTDLSSTVANGTTTPVITLNVPTASATNRGALSSTDWSTFNSKQAALVSGTNIKTVGGVSLLGSGDVGTIGVGYGGTGRTSYTSQGVLYANSTSALNTNSGFQYTGSQVGINVGTFDNAYLTINTGAVFGIDIYRSDVAANYSALRFRNTTNSGTYGSIGFDSTGLRINGDAGTIYFTGTSGGEYARFSASGGFSIGNTTDPGAGSLNVNNLAGIGDVANSQAQAIIAAGAVSRRSIFAANYSASCTADGIYYAYTGTTSGTGYNFARYQNATAVVYQVLGNGNVQNANNNYGSTSDIKLKENISDATPKLDNLCKVRIVNYNKIGETTKQLGVIAQELEEIFPGLVEEVIDRDEDGNVLDTTTKSVKYSVFVPMLIKAIQELKSDFDAYVASHP